MKKRTITVEGFPIEIWDFGYAQFMYPSFNGNAEFSADKVGFKKLRHYLRFAKWAYKNMPFFNHKIAS